MGQRGIPGQAKTQRVKIGFEVVAALWAPMNGDASRLVYDEH
jgi:hypothetical protein